MIVFSNEITYIHYASENFINVTLIKTFFFLLRAYIYMFI